MTWEIKDFSVENKGTKNKKSPEKNFRAFFNSLHSGYYFLEASFFSFLLSAYIVTSYMIGVAMNIEA